MTPMKLLGRGEGPSSKQSKCQDLRWPPLLPLEDVVLVVEAEFAAVRLLLDDGVDRAVHVQDYAPRTLSARRWPQLDDGV